MSIVSANDEVIYTRHNGHTDASTVVVAHPPLKLMTNDNGEFARLRVDVAQTGFFAGNEYRTFYRFNIASGSVRVIKVVVPIDIILLGLEVSILSGELDVSTKFGGTEGGVFNTSLPNISRNTMSTAPVIASQLVITTGGTHTGGTEIDALIVKAATATAQAQSVGASMSDERGIGAGTYYFVLTAAAPDSAVGVIKTRWEERP